MHGGGGGGGGGGGPMRSLVHGTDEKPKITRSLLKRVFAYAWPYRGHLAILLFLILVMTGLNLVNPLIMRTLIDRAIPEKNLTLLLWLSIGLLVVPTISALLHVMQRRINATVA